MIEVFKVTKTEMLKSTFNSFLSDVRKSHGIVANQTIKVVFDLFKLQFNKIIFTIYKIYLSA